MSNPMLPFSVGYRPRREEAEGEYTEILPASAPLLTSERVGLRLPSNELETVTQDGDDRTVVDVLSIHGPSEIELKVAVTLDELTITAREREAAEPEVVEFTYPWERS